MPTGCASLQKTARSLRWEQPTRPRMRSALSPGTALFQYFTEDPPAEVIGNPEVEAVMIASPEASTHRTLVLATLAAGKPLFCEKPLAPTFAEIQELCSAVTASGLTAQVGFHSRFHPLHRSCCTTP